MKLEEVLTKYGCMCPCHIHHSTIFHCAPCCQLCYAKYLELPKGVTYDEARKKGISPALVLQDYYDAHVERITNDGSTLQKLAKQLAEVLGNE